eukprot:SAG31_NODE_3835_length_3836_cov_1.537062_2_plen_52_part_00
MPTPWSMHWMMQQLNRLSYSNIYETAVEVSTPAWDKSSPYGDVNIVLNFKN